MISSEKVGLEKAKLFVSKIQKVLPASLALMTKTKKSRTFNSIMVILSKSDTVLNAMSKISGLLSTFLFTGCWWTI